MRTFRTRGFFAEHNEVRLRRRGGMADAEDLKSSGGLLPCGFDSHRRHFLRGSENSRRVTGADAPVPVKAVFWGILPQPPTVNVLGQSAPATRSIVVVRTDDYARIFDAIDALSKFLAEFTTVASAGAFPVSPPRRKRTSS